MKDIWVMSRDKERFINNFHGSYLSEISDPYFKITQRHNGIPSMVTKYYHYRIGITDEEYLFLKLQFDLKEEL